MGEVRTQAASAELPEFAESFRLLFPVIFNVAFRWMHDRAAAEDVAQDVFAIGFRKYHQFRGQRLANYRNYLWTVCRSCCHRRMGRARRAAMAQGLTPPQSADRQLAFALEEACRAILSEEEYLLLALYYSEGYTYEEIAERIGRSVAWVFQRSKLIRDKLRRVLERDDLQVVRAAARGVAC